MGALAKIEDRLPTTWKHDGALALATGQSRHDTKWKNIRRPWSALADRLREPVRTGESQADYDQMSKERKATLKDVGGYVGGALLSGRRTAESLRLRQLIVLDIDYGQRDAILGVLDPDWGVGSFAWILHSTRSDRFEQGTDRMRLLIPLSRAVTADEYPAVARRIAGDIGIEAFDETTFEPHRLMYWPSVSHDQTYWIEGCDRPWLDVDAVLARYIDWRDPQEWPASSKAIAARAPKGGQAEDPTLKPGLVGAFCRRYSITAVLEDFLSEEYAPGGADGRWTYRKGSSIGGLVVYDNLWAYSHHGTDPAAGKLLNAWDLVRLHKFGELDKDEPETAPLRDLPSTREMLTWAGAIPEIREQLGRDRLAAAVADFSSSGATLDGLSLAAEDLTGSVANTTPVNPDDQEWMRALEVTEKGVVKPSRHNIGLILRNDPMLAGKIGHDEMADTTVARGRLPWSIEADAKQRSSHPDKDRGTVIADRRWTDRDDAGLRAYLERVWRIDKPTAVMDAFELVSRSCGFHPVRDYLNRLPAWDGQNRLDNLFTDYLGARACPYTRAASRKFAVAAIARVMRPGCKADHVVCLSGPQGAGKSTFLSVLGSPWHTDNLPSIHGKEASETIAGTWIVEIAELVATRKADVEHVKAFISRQVERYRPAYGRRVVEQPRQCVFVMTTNDTQSLTDATGNRRYWPIDCAMVGEGPATWAAKLARERDQIWAEAMVRWSEGEPLFMEHAETSKAAKAAQEAHTEDGGDLSGEIAAWLEMPVPKGWSKRSHGQRKMALQNGLMESFEEGDSEMRERVCSKEIWVECLLGAPDRFTSVQARRIHQAMARVPGWGRTANGTAFGPYGVGRGWKRDYE